MFNEITQPTIRVRAQQRYTVAVSILIHAGALLALAVIPLMATDVLPTPFSAVDTFSVPTPPPPTPPPSSEMANTAPAPPVFVDSADPVPFEAPSAIASEPLPVMRPAVYGISGAVTLSRGEAVVAPPPSVPVRVGGDIKAPAKIFDARPVYPAIAKAARMSGVVFLEAVIAKDGRVKDLRVTRSAGVLDQAAIDAVSQWRYTPTMLNGEAVEVVMSVTVNFTLN